jgi:hypothetical protein
VQEGVGDRSEFWITQGKNGDSEVFTIYGRPDGFIALKSKDGVFHFPEDVAVPSSFFVFADGYALTRVTLIEENRDLMPLSIALDKAEDIQCAVASSGRPVPGCQVHIGRLVPMIDTPSPARLGEGWCRTDESGHCILKNLPTGFRKVVFCSDGFGPACVEIPLNVSAPLSVELRSPATLTVQALGSTQAMSKARVLVACRTDADYTFLTSSKNVDASGRVQFTELPEGKAEVLFFGSSQTQPTSQKVQLSSGTETKVEFTLPKKQ